MSPVTGLARVSGRILLSVHMENFSLVYPGRTRKSKKHNKIVEYKLVGDHLSRSFMCSCNFSNKATKERVARRELGNRAGPVDRTHMKRPLAGFHAFRLPRLNWNLQILVFGKEENSENLKNKLWRIQRYHRQNSNLIRRLAQSLELANLSKMTKLL